MVGGCPPCVDSPARWKTAPQGGKHAMSRKVDLDGYDEETRRSIEGMIEAEERAIRQRRFMEEEELCECKDGMFPRTDRRNFLVGATAAAGAGAAALFGRRASAAAPPAWH